MDKKFALNYYARMRFAVNLLPQLTAAASAAPPLARIVSVFSAGYDGDLIADDLALRTHYSVRNCRTHATTMHALYGSPAFV